MNNTLLALLGGGLGLFLFKDQLFGKKQNKQNLQFEDQPKKEETNQNFPLLPSTQFNPLVKRLQEALTNFGRMPKIHIQNSGGADGFYGNGTKRALEAYGVNGSSVNAQIYAEILRKGGLL